MPLKLYLEIIMHFTASKNHPSNAEKSSNNVKACLGVGTQRYQHLSKLRGRMSDFNSNFLHQHCPKCKFTYSRYKYLKIINCFKSDNLYIFTI